MQLAAMEVNRIYATRWCKWGTSVLVTLAVAMLAARTRGTHPTLGPYVPTAATNASNFGCSTNGLCSTNCRVDVPRLSQLLGGIALQCTDGNNCQYIREIAGSGATAGINTLQYKSLFKIFQLRKHRPRGLGLFACSRLERNRPKIGAERGARLFGR